MATKFDAIMARRGERWIAGALNLNDDLAETIALAHDLGHSPFGHKGEEVLDQLMRGHGGFEHNLQSFRTVDELEERYPSFDGLNLTWEVRESIAKHVTTYDHPSARDFDPGLSQPAREKANLRRFAGALASLESDETAPERIGRRAHRGVLNVFWSNARGSR